jgi:biopolymer transport protein ExbB
MKRSTLARMLQIAALMSISGVICYAQPEGVDEVLDADGRETLFSLIVKGGFVMIPIALASIVALALAVERFIALKRSNVIPADFLSGLGDSMKWHPANEKDGIAYCEKTGGMVGNMFKAGISRIRKGDEAMEKAIEDAGYREADKMKRSLRGLVIIASTSPLLGLLGTVYGMIGAFQTATIKGMEAGGGADHLAKGIYEALVTTAAGLTVAIPVMLVYQILNSKVDGIVDELDDMGIEFMTKFADQGDGGGGLAR